MKSALDDPTEKTAVVTGAASGLGRELALQRAKAGMKVVLTDVDEAGLEQTASLAGVASDRVLLQRCDVSRPDEVDALARAVREGFGNVHLLDTGIADAGRHRPAQLASANPNNAALMERTRGATKASLLSAADIARLTMEAVGEQRFYILPHPKAAGRFEQRAAELLRGNAPNNPLAPPP